MPRKNWKRVQATSLRHALELCLAYAKDKNNLGVERVADLMGIPNHWALYKYLENGRMPAILIRPFEHACGINFITQYLAHSDNNLLVRIPTGKKATGFELSELGAVINETNQLLHLFYEGKKEANEVIDSIFSVMENLAYHKGNIEKQQQPELDFENNE
jgi:hypothetical protein